MASPPRERLPPVLLCVRRTSAGALATPTSSPMSSDGSPLSHRGSSPESHPKETPN